MRRILRFFLDTNVLASALEFEGNEALLLRALMKGPSVGVTSEFVLTELADVLQKKFGRSLLEVDEAIERLRPLLLQPPADRPTEQPPASPDQRVVQDALAVSAHYVVTGDRKMLRTRAISGTAIVGAADGLRILGLTPKRARKGI